MNTDPSSGGSEYFANLFEISIENAHIVYNCYRDKKLSEFHLTIIEEHLEEWLQNVADFTCIKGAREADVSDRITRKAHFPVN